jgi:chloramphenicol O-acetyltransferase
MLENEWKNIRCVGEEHKHERDLVLGLCLHRLKSCWSVRTQTKGRIDQKDEIPKKMRYLYFWLRTVTQHKQLRIKKLKKTHTTCVTSTLTFSVCLPELKTMPLMGATS